MSTLVYVVKPYWVTVRKNLITELLKFVAEN